MTALAEDPVPLRHHDLEVDGIRVRVFEAGAGPPVLLLHGYIVSHLEWSDVIPLLARRHRVVAPDLPGFGESERPERFGYDRTSYASLIVHLLNRLGIDRTDVAGHSYGASVAVVLASIAPERVRRLALLDASCYPFPVPLKGRIPLLPFVGRFVFLHLFGHAVFLDYFRHQVFNGKLPFVDRVEAYYRAFHPLASRRAALRVLRDSVDTEPVAPHLGRVAAPTLIAWGKEDRIIPVAHAATLAAAIPGARTVILPGCGHAPNEEFPERTAELLLDHFSGEELR